MWNEEKRAELEGFIQAMANASFPSCSADPVLNTLPLGVDEVLQHAGDHFRIYYIDDEGRQRDAWVLKESLRHL